MKVNNSEKIVWKHRCAPSYYTTGILIVSIMCIVFLQIFITPTLLDFSGLNDIIFIITITPIFLALPFYLLYKWGKYFFILKVQGSTFSIKTRLIAFTKRFYLSEIQSMEFLLTRARYRYYPNPSIIGKDVKDNNLLYLYLTIILKDIQEREYTFKVIRFYHYRTTPDTPFLDKSYAVKDQFINELINLKILFPNIVSVRDEVQRNFDIF